MRKIKSCDAAILVQPPPPEDITKAARLIDAFWNIHDGHYTPEEKALYIRRLFQHFKTKDCGEIAAAELVYYMPDPGVPVFYCTEDSDAMRRVHGRAQNFPVYLLNTGMFYGALQQHSLLHAVGIKDMPQDEFCEGLWAQQEKPGSSFKTDSWLRFNHKFFEALEPFAAALHATRPHRIGEKAPQQLVVA